MLASGEGASERIQPGGREGDPGVFGGIPWWFGGKGITFILEALFFSWLGVIAYHRFLTPEGGGKEGGGTGR